MDALGPHHAHALRYDEAAVRALVLNHIVDGVQCTAMMSDASVLTHQGETVRSKCRRVGTYIQGLSYHCKHGAVTRSVQNHGGRNEFTKITAQDT